MFMKRRWKRDQKYWPRDRVLYALLFPNGCCYIGQSVDPRKREAQHRSASGGWSMPFDLIVLGTCHGTQAEASDHEHAWRLAAVAHGWRVYALPPGVLCNPARQASLQHHRLSKRFRKRWPRAHSRRFVNRMLKFFRLVS